MGNYSHYDTAEDVIFTDVSSVVLTRETFDDIIDEIITIAQGLGRRVHLLVCWGNAKIDANLLEHWAQRIQDLHNYHILGIARYAVADTSSQNLLRSGAARHGIRGTAAEVFATRAEALAAIRSQET